MESLTLSLKQLGLSLNESKAYLCLLRKSGVTGYELSKNAGVPPSKIYDSLNKLLGKGFISVIKSNYAPKYVAIEPAKNLERYQKDYNRTLDTLKKQLRAISQRPEAFNQYLWHLSDRAQILDKIREIVEGSRKMVYLSVWKEELQEVEPQIKVAFGKKWERLRNVMVKEAKTVRLSPERPSGKRKKKKTLNPREISGASS